MNSLKETYKLFAGVETRFKVLAKMDCVGMEEEAGKEEVKLRKELKQVTMVKAASLALKEFPILNR